MPFNIILIEDDEEMCEELKYILEDRGYHVELAYSALSGIEKIKGGIFQLVLLDIKMPEVSGEKVLRFIKSNGLDLKVIVLTGSPLDSVRAGLVESQGCFESVDYVMNKPFDIDQLLLKIKELTETRK